MEKALPLDRGAGPFFVPKSAQPAPLNPRQQSHVDDAFGAETLISAFARLMPLQWRVVADSSATRSRRKVQPCRFPGLAFELLGGLSL